jgi:hypothetical protein
VKKPCRSTHAPEGFGSYTRGCASAPQRNSTTTRREERPINKRQPLRVPNGYHLRGSGATVGDNHKGPLMTSEKTPFWQNNKTQTNPQTANHTPRNRGPVLRRAHSSNNLSGLSSGQLWYPSGELLSRSRARHRTTKSPLRSRGRRPMGRISTSLEGQMPPWANLHLARGVDAPLGESPPRSRGRRPLGQLSASLDDSAPPQAILRLPRGLHGLVMPAPTPPTRALNALTCHGRPGQKRILTTPTL